MFTKSIDYFIKNKIISNNFSLIHYGTRDNPDINVYRCNETGTIFLNKDVKKIKNYPKRSHINVTIKNEDVLRRTSFLSDKLIGKIWLDIGSGTGSILYALKGKAKKTFAIEPIVVDADSININGVEVYYSIKEFLNITKNSLCDVITMFHVLEHLTDPIHMLNAIYHLMDHNSVLYIEVPHAKEVLIKLYNNIAYKDFTFWSEHLILYTEQSLKNLLQHIGYRYIKVSPIQRYSFVNHLYWLSKGEPRGDKKWKLLYDSKINALYTNKLCDINMTDTLFVEVKL